MCVGIRSADYEKQSDPKEAKLLKVWVNLLSLSGHSCYGKHQFPGHWSQGLWDLESQSEEHPEYAGSDRGPSLLIAWERIFSATVDMGQEPGLLFRIGGVGQ